MFLNSLRVESPAISEIQTGDGGRRNRRLVRLATPSPDGHINNIIIIFYLFGVCVSTRRL